MKKFLKKQMNKDASLIFCAITIIFFTNAYPARSEQKVSKHSVKECDRIKIGKSKAEIENLLGNPTDVITGDTIAAGELTQGKRYRKFPIWLYRNKGIKVIFNEKTNKVDSYKCERKNQ